MIRFNQKVIIPIFWTGSLITACAFSLVLCFDVFTEILLYASELEDRERYWNLTRADLLLWFIRMVFFLSIGFLGGLYLQGFYLRYDSYEALFLFFWLFTITLAPWRLLNFKMDFMQLQMWGVFLSRLFAFLEIAGFTFLTLISVVFGNRNIHRMGTLVSITWIFAFLIGFGYPIDSFWLSKRFMLGWSVNPVLSHTVWVLYFTGVLSIYFWLYYRNSIEEAKIMGLASGSLYTGWFLINSFNYYTAVLVGGGLLTLGVWLYIKGISRYYAPWR